MLVHRSTAAALTAFALLAGCGAGCEGVLEGTRDAGPDAARDLVAAPPADSAVPGREGPGRVDAASPPPPAFSCALPAASPTLAPKHWLHPASPSAGQTVTVVLQSGNTKPPQAPKLVTEVRDRRGARTVTSYELAGGEKAIFYISVGDLAEGESCIVVRNGAAVELALKLSAPKPSPVARGSGVWKVTRNHQWTCQEQPTWGNLLKVKVIDEGGAPVNGAKVSIRVTDDTVFPVKPDESAMSWQASAHPKVMTTGTSGEAALMTPWGEGIRSPIDAKPGYLVYLLSVEGGASDVATEITTGLWEADFTGCNYCSTFAVNVYGHWSHTVEFRRDSKATKVCEVPIDHQGQEKCTFRHFYHDPDRPSCLPVAP